jgi:hypothetical protein
MKSIQSILVIGLFFLSSIFYAQKGKNHNGGHDNGHRGHGNNHRNGAMMKHSHYRPKHAGVYHPHWHSNYSYNRRWVYFPKYNMYWDNWRNHYVFWNGNLWMSQANTPAMIININLQNEKRNELNEDEDDRDDIFNSNDNHKSTYKP